MAADAALVAVAAAASLVGWAGWLAVGVGIAGLDLTLAKYAKTTLSDTWLAGARNKTLRPLEAATFTALGAHLFAGAPLWPLIGSSFALGSAVVFTAVKHK